VSRVRRRTDRDHLEFVENSEGDAVLRQKPLTVEPRAVGEQTSDADPEGDGRVDRRVYGVWCESNREATGVTIQAVFDGR
jgi:hypothetical protein